MTLRLTNIIHWHQARPRLAVGVHLAATLFFLGFALISQYAFGLHPCVLCLWQRVPYGLIAIGALISLLLAPRYTPLFLAGFAILYGVETGIAIHHVGVEEHWWHSAAGCGFDGRPSASINDLYQKIANASVTPCDAKAWQFLSLTMAGWNAILSAGLCGLATLQSALQMPWWSARK